MAKPKRHIVKSKNARILIIPDVHFPFQDNALLRKVYGLVTKLKPTHIVQVGDLIDAYCFSSFARSSDITTPVDEIKGAVKGAASMWKTLQRLSPKSKCFQLMGNHDQRIMKYMIRQAPSLESLVEPKIQELFKYPNVYSLSHEKDELVIGDVTFVHGFLSKSGDHTRYFLENVARGHSHGASTTFIRKNGKTLFELESGCLINVNAEVFEYKHTATSKWIPSVGFIDTFGPRVIVL